MSGISDKAIKSSYAENKYRYNDGTELANKEFSDGSGLDFYETGYRSYDPQLGRFWQLDPIGEATPDWSPYLYAADNPIFFNDPMGLDTAHYGDPVVVTPNSNKPIQRAFIPGTSKPNSPSTDFQPPPDEVSDLPINQPNPLNDPGPKVFPLVGPGAVGTVIITATLTLLPNSFGQEGIPQPNPLFSPNEPDSKYNERDKSITLYRGVPPDHPGFNDALQGIARPWGIKDGHDDPKLHNDGFTYSIFTSWTARPSVAAKFAGRYGVVLVKRFYPSQLVPSPDKYKEQEILVPGIVYGAEVYRTWTTKRL